MAIVKTSSFFAAVGAASFLVLVACDPSGGGAAESSSSGTSGATSGDPGTTTGMEPSTSGSSSTTLPPPSTSSTGPEPGSSTTDDETSSTGGSDSSSSGGEPTDCVDEDIGSAVGDEVASGTNVGQGDDFQLRYCFGDWGPGPTSGFGTGDTDSFGGTDSFGTGVGTTGGIGTTGGWDPDGEDYVIEWTPPESGEYVIDTFGSPMDTVLSVVPPKCGSNARICNDDCQSLESAVIYDATEGETVYIVVEGYSGEDGSFVLNITAGDELECSFGPGTGGGSTTTTTPTATAGR